MEKTADQVHLPGSRQLNLKKLFKLGIHSLLTTCSKEEFSKAFPTFSSAEQGDLHHLYIQKSLLRENKEELRIQMWIMLEAGVIRVLVRKASLLGLLIVTELHENIEDEFESLSLETQLGTTLDTVEQLVEERSMDSLFSDKSNVGDVECTLLAAKKNEIQYLMGVLEKAEEQKGLIGARVELLEKERQDFSGGTDAAEKLRSMILNYGT